jgi:indolepyruvate ferredoxin oxidoreductase
MLAKGKKLRGTAFDPFGQTRMRRLERRLADHYEAAVTKLLDDLAEDSYDRACAAATAADIVRGYEEVKLANVERYLTRLAELGIDTTMLAE